VRNNLSRSPFTATIATVGLYDCEREAGVVYVTHPAARDYESEPFLIKARTEETLLADLWSGLLTYDTVVTYDGLRTVASFLLVRSAVRGVTNVCDLRYRHSPQGITHRDLACEFSAAPFVRRETPALAVVAAAFGHDPRAATVLTPAVVSEWWANHDVQALVAATANQTKLLATIYRDWCRVVPTP
jgi:hypothetical protein